MKKVLKFSASWCGPCKMLSKTIDSAGDLGVYFEEIDIDDNLNLSAEYGIRSVPTMVMIEDNIEIKRTTGALNLKQLKDFING